MARFKEIAELFEELEKITSHKEIVRKISEFFRELKGDEVKDSAYLFFGSIGPAFEKTTLGIKDKLAVRAIAGAYGVPEEGVKKRYARTGDLGDVAFELSKKMEASLTVEDVFHRLEQIKEASGKGSQEEKTGFEVDRSLKGCPLEFWSKKV